MALSLPWKNAPFILSQLLCLNGKLSAYNGQRIIYFNAFSEMPGIHTQPSINAPLLCRMSLTEGEWQRDRDGLPLGTAPTNVKVSTSAQPQCVTTMPGVMDENHVSSRVLPAGLRLTLVVLRRSDAHLVEKGSVWLQPGVCCSCSQMSLPHGLSRHAKCIWNYDSHIHY